MLTINSSRFHDFVGSSEVNCMVGGSGCVAGIYFCFVRMLYFILYSRLLNLDVAYDLG